MAMVRFLVEQGADVEASDNEGWTALHATASCGFVNMARYVQWHLMHLPPPSEHLPP